MSAHPPAADSTSVGERQNAIGPGDGKIRKLPICHMAKILVNDKTINKCKETESPASTLLQSPGLNLGWGAMSPRRKEHSGDICETQLDTMVPAYIHTATHIPNKPPYHVQEMEKPGSGDRETLPEARWSGRQPPGAHGGLVTDALCLVYVNGLCSKYPCFPYSPSCVSQRAPTIRTHYG